MCDGQFDCLDGSDEGGFCGEDLYEYFLKIYKFENIMSGICAVTYQYLRGTILDFYF